MYRSTDKVLIYGRNMVFDALSSSRNVTGILVSQTSVQDPKIQAIISKAKSVGEKVVYVGQKELDNQTDKAVHQGVLAYMDLPGADLESILKSKRDAFIILIDKLDYDQNLGSILRTAWACGADAVVASPSGIHEVSPAVAKISVGGAAYVPVIAQSLFQTISLLNKYAVKVIGVEANLGTDYTQADLSGTCAFVMGGEATGLTKPMVEKCDLLINIPMVKSVASLNVSVATALVCFEKTRQERARS